jgi:hypothetical protein
MTSQGRRTLRTKSKNVQSIIEDPYRDREILRADRPATPPPNRFIFRAEGEIEVEYVLQEKKMRWLEEKTSKYSVGTKTLYHWRKNRRVCREKSLPKVFENTTKKKNVNKTIRKHSYDSHYDSVNRRIIKVRVAMCILHILYLGITVGDRLTTANELKRFFLFSYSICKTKKRL